MTSRETAITTRILAIIVLILVFYAGIQIGQVPPGPRLTTNNRVAANENITPTVKYRVLESGTIGDIEEHVVVVEYVERVKIVPMELRNFNSLEELAYWLSEVEARTNAVYFQAPDNTVDCDDYALALQQRALADGYIMSLEITETIEYNGLFNNSDLAPDSLHAVNLVIIGNDVYYIEPQTGEVVFAVFLD